MRLLLTFENTIHFPLRFLSAENVPRKTKHNHSRCCRASKTKSLCDTLFASNCLRTAARTLVMFSAIMTNEGNDCTCLPDCYCATHDTDTASRLTDLQCSTLDWRVSGEFWSLYKLNPRQKPALEILGQENLDNSCPCFWHPLLHLIWWRSGDVPLLSSLHHFLSTCRRTGRGAWGFVVFFVMGKGRNVAPKKPSLTANEELRKEEDGSDEGGVEGGDWFLPSFPP